MTMLTLLLLLDGMTLWWLLLQLLGASPMLREPVIIIKGKQAHVFNEQVNNKIANT